MDRIDTSRRQFLLAGAGVAAALVAGTALDAGLVRAAQSWPITGQVGDIGPFEILSYSFSSSNAGGAPSGKGKTKFDQVTFVKNLDGFSSELFSAAVNADSFATASITVEGTGGRPTTYLMSDVLITNYDAGGSGTESVTLQFARLRTVRR